MKRLKDNLKKVTLKKLHIQIIVIGIIFVSLGAFHCNIWFDESYSVGLARHTFREIWSIGGYDVHPILYYWCLRIIYLITGGSILAYRIFSIIPIGIMIILGYTHIRKDFGEKTGFIFSFLAVFLPTMALYAIEIRMYSWAILTVTILAIYAYRLVKEDNIKNWIIFGICSLASIYLHYYGLMAAGLINISLLIYLIVKKRRKGIIFILSFGIIQGLVYLPWLINLVTQINYVSNEFWIKFTFPKTLMEILSSQLVGYIETTDDYSELLVPTVLSLELYAYMIYKTYIYRKKRQEMKPYMWSVGMYLAVIVAALIITKILGAEILYYRYLFVITGLYIFAVSYILGNEKNNISVALILIVIMVLGINNNIGMIKDNYSKSNEEPINYMKKNIHAGDTIVYKDYANSGAITAIYFKENQVYFYNEEDWGVTETYKAFGPNYEVHITKSFIEKCSNRVWVIDNVYGDAVEKIFDETEYQIISEEKFFTEYHDYSYKITLVQK